VRASKLEIRIDWRTDLMVLLIEHLRDDHGERDVKERAGLG
jgi:hypothetical protein